MGVPQSPAPSSEGKANADEHVVKTNEFCWRTGVGRADLRVKGVNVARSQNGCEDGSPVVGVKLEAVRIGHLIQERVTVTAVQNLCAVSHALNSAIEVIFFF